MRDDHITNFFFSFLQTLVTNSDDIVAVAMLVSFIAFVVIFLLVAIELYIHASLRKARQKYLKERHKFLQSISRLPK